MQNSPAPSSGEAELNACSKGFSEVLSIRHFLSQIGIDPNVRHYIDASAAKGTLMRKGAGKIKHLEVRQLWCQYAVEKYGIEVIKIPRELNLADGLTHGIGKKEQALFHEAIGISARSLEPAPAAVGMNGSSLAVAGSSTCSCMRTGIWAEDHDGHCEAGTSSKAGNVLWGPWGQGGVMGDGGCGSAHPPLNEVRRIVLFPSISFRRWLDAQAL